MTTLIDVIVCSKDGGELFELCLKALLRQTALNKVYVITPSVESGASKGARNFEDVIVIIEPEKSCLAWARRLAVDHTTAPYLAYIDDDVVLGKDHLQQLLDYAQHLEKRYEHIAVEGILTSIVLENSITLTEEGKYTPGILAQGARGCTHNTLLRRETVESWKPHYAFAWEDWLLTQHVQNVLGGIWVRYHQKAYSIHVREYGNFRRSAWDCAGERIAKKNAKAWIVLKRSVKVCLTGLRDTFKFRNVKIFVSRSLLALGMIVGFFNWNSYIRLPVQNR